MLRISTTKYEISVTGIASDQRTKKLNDLMSILGKIPLGSAGQHDFEDWCYRAIGTVFAASLTALELPKPVGAGRSGRLTALNIGRVDSWKKLGDDFGVHQALFVLRNEESVKQEEYVEAIKDLPGECGKVVFLVTRDDRVEMAKDGELSWVRGICQTAGIIVVKITGHLLASMLGKLRNPQKHDAVESTFGGYMAVYLNNYLKGHAARIMTTQLESSGAVQPVPIGASADGCYGELDCGQGGMYLRVFLKKQGEGRRAEVCDPIPLRNQAVSILEAGIADARRRYIEDKYEQMRGDGRPDDRSECEPPAEMTFDLVWTQDQLAAIVENKSEYGHLKKRGKDALKTAMSRLRNLVNFTTDGRGLVTDADAHHIRRSVIPLRLRKSGQP